MVIEDVGNWFCNQTTGWLNFLKSWPRQEYNKNVRNLMLPQWLCGRERLNAWTDVIRAERRVKWVDNDTEP